MLLQSPPPEFIRGQIQQLVVDNVTDISPVAISRDNPLYQLYQYGVGYEVHLYLNAMDGSGDVTAELIVALDETDPEVVLGFLLYLPVNDDPLACAVAFMAVRESHRRQGIARSMLEKMRVRRPHAELTCVTEKVAWFEALGFQVLGARGPHVLMNTHDHGTDGLLAVLEVGHIYQSLEVRQIHAYLLKQQGEPAMIEAERLRDLRLDEMTRQAETFVARRLGRAPRLNGVHTPGMI
jgi:ribosomal protein S18 acetylase RimI-like enzyme